MTSFALAGGVLLGVVIGIIYGLIGIGGGSFLIPALVFFYGMSQKTAQGTSVATLLFAFWTYYKAGHIKLKLAMLIAIGFAVGGWFGGLWAQHFSDVVLRRSFAVLLSRALKGTHYFGAPRDDYPRSRRAPHPSALGILRHFLEHGTNVLHEVF